MTIEYRPVSPEDADLLVEFLTSDPWPFHAGSAPTPATIRERAAAGHYFNDENRGFWLVLDGEEAGLVRVTEMHSGMPQTDMRIRAAHRGKGLATHGLRWRTTYLFTELPELQRIEACFRQDNWAIRKVLLKCGYAKEAHFRQAWPGEEEGKFHDSVIYSILRSDWESGAVTPVAWDDEAGLAR